MPSKNALPGMLPAKGAMTMTEREMRRMSDLLEENNLVSATEFTGALPAISQDPAHGPLPHENEHPYDTHSLQKSTPFPRPASRYSPSRQDSGRNP